MTPENLVVDQQFTNREIDGTRLRVRTPAELGALFRAERIKRGLTLADVYHATGLSIRFLSEFERGKENASLGRVLRALESFGLEVLVVPRAESKRIRAQLQKPRLKKEP